MFLTFSGNASFGSFDVSGLNVTVVFTLDCQSAVYPLFARSYRKNNRNAAANITDIIEYSLNRNPFLFRFLS